MRLREALKSIGPGLLFAGAAIGVSHIMQSTRAGAGYGFALLIFVILSNFFKYPFFEYGHRYTASTGESLIEGYAKMGKFPLFLFFILNNITSVISAAGVTIVTAALSNHLLDLFFNFSLDITLMSGIILLTTILLLVLGKYKALDLLIKILIVVLSISSIIAFFLAASNVMQIKDDFIPPDLLSYSTFIFLIALMGWMPAPIEASVWSSLWAKQREEETGYRSNLKQALFDFKVGYIGTAILAVVFLSLGAFVMYGTGEVFAESAVGFAKQLISLYTETLGTWSKVIISIVALITMVSTTITVVDAYPRSLEACLRSIFNNRKRSYIIYLILVSIIALIIINYFSKDIKSMVDLATTISFVAAPIFSWLNYKLVIGENLKEEDKPSKAMRLLSVAGLIFLIIFTLIYFYVANPFSIFSFS